MRLPLGLIPKRVFYSTKTPTTKPNLLIVSSIGNPEPQYTNTRHNAGHLVNNYLTHTKFQPHPQVPNTEYAHSKKYFKNLFFTKSLTYMNLSGQSVIPSWLYYKKKYERDFNVSYLVLHDELGKETGKHQLRFGGNEISSRGHNGLKSIVEHNHRGIKFFRLGIGISRPASRKGDDVANYVLGKMSEEETNKILFELLPKIEEIITNFVK